ncbi:diaminopimelate epimerase [Candidatus Bandiella euplotis]|uniref:Diaminopimelate epimerase n=1 Tax=Candidatus Bandiella euplotis TaxID=1664265 RepID=A0ABZ0UJM9_9RICK|nr:diaminopimelate epimerase [Candidatus Bandiella woodruffii]WPX96311.1 Diaminopimelate epimerase [Candidatus Bandiella woodruffii]
MADFYKYHGLGNDYLVIDPRKISFGLNLHEENIRLICHRNYGIGSDGILYGPIQCKDGEIGFKIFNPDGSEAEKSGNGIRIFALYVLDQLYVNPEAFEKESPYFNLHTKGGKVCVQLIDAKTNTIKVDMGKYSFITLDGLEAINKEIKILGQSEMISCVDIGNPHCVVIKEKATEELARQLGPVLENHELFPNRTNVQIMEILDQSNIKIEIWERGAGYTLASGTSSSASSCVAHKLGFVGRSVTVHMPGGKVNVEIAKENVYLTGVATRVFKGDFAKDLKYQLISNKS